LKRFLTPEGV